MDFLTSERLTGLIQAAYIVAALLFILALAGLSKHETAKARQHLRHRRHGARARRDARRWRLDNSQYDDQRPLAVTLLIVVAMAIGAVDRRCGGPASSR